MTRNLKALGSALIAVFAISVVVASSASAHYVFTSADSPTALTGEQIEGKHKLAANGISVEFGTASFSGTQSGLEANELTITPVYTNCAYATKACHVTMNGCTYTITGETTASGHGTIHVICPTVGGIKQKIEIHLTNFSGTETCTLTIAEQTPNQGYSATNTGNDTRLVTTMSGIIISTDGAALACKALAVGNATYTGVTTLRGYKDPSSHGAADQIKISVDS